MWTTLFGALFDGLPLVPLAVAFVWTLRYQKVADLSLAGSFSVASAITAYLMSAGNPAFISITIGLLIGLLVGLAMGVVINALYIEPLLSGLIVLFVTYAMSLGITQGTIRIAADRNPLEWIFALEGEAGLPLWAHPWANLFFLVVAVISIALSTWYFSSEMGCAFRALEDLKGGRPFLKSVGISPARLSLIGFGVAGILASMSGVLVALRDRQTTSSLGLDSLIEIIPAYLLGITLFERRPILKKTQEPSSSRHELLARFDGIVSRLNLLKIFPPAFAAGIGVIVFFVTINFVQRVASVPWLPRVLIGVVLLALLGLQPGLTAWRRKRQQMGSTILTEPTRSLQISNLSVVYPTSNGTKTVLRDVNLEVSPGEIALLKGHNGSGKSTLLRALVDQVDCAGNFSIPTPRPSKKPTERASLIAYVPQDVDENSVATLSIGEHIVLSSLGSKISPFTRWDRNIRHDFQKLDVNDVVTDPHTLIGWLSGGQKRRVSIGLLAVRNPQPIVIALDEIFDDLDVAGQKRCAEILKSLAKDERIILYVDHQSLIRPTRTIDNIWLNSD